MRIPEPRSQATAKDPPDLYFRPAYRVAVWNASISNLIQILNLIFINQIIYPKVALREPKTVCDRISKEAVRELKLKEET